MANPQREDGHIDIANELAEALAKTQLSGNESRIMWAIWRKTWGWVKRKNGKYLRDKNGNPIKLKKASITSKDWEELTGLLKGNISRTLKRLESRNIVIKFDNKNTWGFQKDYDKWLPPVKESVIKNDNKISEPICRIDNGICRIDNKKPRKPISDKKEQTYKETLKETVSNFDSTVKPAPHKKSGAGERKKSLPTFNEKNSEEEKNLTEEDEEFYQEEEA